jgi:hypothetical protein
MTKLWRICVAIVLATTAVCKLTSLHDPSTLLLQDDPVFAVRISTVMVLAAILELGICVFLFSVRSARMAAMGVFAFAVSVLSYRLALYMSGVHFCPCLGTAVAWWPWLGGHEGEVMVTVAVWLLLTSAVQIFPMPMVINSRFFGGNPLVMKAAVPVIFALLLLVCLSPWSIFSFGFNEGVHLSKSLLLLKHPETVQVGWHSPGWSYPQVCAWIFSLTGFHPWIPRIITILIMGALWGALPRLMPAPCTWRHAACAVLLFCCWPNMLFFAASATPQINGLGLAFLSAALLSGREENKNGWRIGLASMIFLAAVWIDIDALVTLPAIITMLVIRYSAGRGFLAGKSLNQPALNLAVAIVVLAIIAVAAFRFISAPGTVLAAALGVFILWKRGQLLELPFSLALLVAVVWWHYLRPNDLFYLIYLAIPLVTLGGFGLVELFSGLSRMQSARESQPASVAAISTLTAALAVSLWFGFEWPKTRAETRLLNNIGVENRAPLSVIRPYAGQVKWIYSPDCGLAVQAGCVMPRELLDFLVTAPNRDAEIVSAVHKFKCEMLVLSAKHELLDANWLQLLDRQYTQLWSDGDQSIFVIKGLADTKSLSMRQSPAAF